MTGTDDTGDGDDAGEVGGDPVCWAHLLCPECGAVPDRADDDRCARCGTAFPPADD